MQTSNETDLVEARARPYGSRTVLVAVALLLAAHALLAWLGRPPGIVTGGDDARYLFLGQALRHFRYVEYWHVGWPIHSLYPPGYPLLLGLWSFVAGSGFDAQVLLGIGLSVGSLWAVYLLTERHLEPALALAVVAALAFNPTLIARAGTIASEPPYELWSALALLALLGPRSNRNVALAAGFAIAAALTRTAGATLVAAVVFTLLLRRRFAGAAWTAAAAALLLGPWLAWTALAPEQHVGASYVADALSTVQRHEGAGLLGALVGRFVNNGLQYAVAFVNYTLPYPNVLAGRADSVAWLIIAVAGLGTGVVAAWRRWQPVIVYLVLYGALLLVWAWPVSRFLEPAALFAVPVWLYGLWSLAGLARIRRAVAVAGVGAAIVAATGAWTSVGLVATMQRCGREPAPPGPNRCLYPAQRDWLAAVRWMRDSTPADAAVLTEKAGDFYYYARRGTLQFNAAIAQPEAGFLDYVRRYGGRYIVLTSLTIGERSRLAGLLATSCRGLAVAAEVAPQAYVLRLRGPGDADGTDACAAVAAYQRAVADSVTSRRWR
jgi:hypothetical protein